VVPHGCLTVGPQVTVEFGGKGSLDGTGNADLPVSVGVASSDIDITQSIHKVFEKGRAGWVYNSYCGYIFHSDPGADHGKEAGPPYGTGDRVGCVLDTDIPSGTTAAALIAPNRSITASLGLQCAGFTMASSARQASES